METLEYKKIITEDDMHIIENEYNIKILDIKQLFIGFDKNTFLYKIESVYNNNYFLKIRTGISNESSIIIPHFLSQKIGKHIIEPVKTKNGHLFFKKTDYTIILYPYIYGMSGIETDLSEKKWIELGELLFKIHNTKLPKDIINIPYEEYSPQWRIRLGNYMEKIYEIQSKDEYTERFINYLNSKRKIICNMLVRIEELVDQIKKLETKFCLCHGDIHAGNIFISDDNELYIVDWDTLIMAPKEKDLMFIGGGVANKWNTKNEEANFYKGYGEQNNINKTLLAYYRYERIITDLVEYYEQFFEIDTDRKNQKIIMEVVNSIFENNNVVEMTLLGDK